MRFRPAPVGVSPMDDKFALIRTHVAGLPALELARQFGTPVFVYDAAVILQRLSDLRQFDVVRYAQKACSSLAVLDLLRRHGALVDAVSAGEVLRALAAGYQPTGDPPPIVYTADIFDRHALELCCQQQIHVNCGSLDMIEQFGRQSPGGHITVRINPGFGHGHSRKTNTGGPHSKHGIWHEQIAESLQLAAKHRLTITGVHMHIGSGTDLEHLAQVCGAMEQAAGQIGPQVYTISAGGGLPIPYRQDQQYVDLGAYFQLWDATRQRLEQRWEHPVRLEIEPGRYIVAESGWLLAEIRAVKRQADNIFYLLDAGFNNLARPILYGAYHPMAIVPADGNTSRKMQEVIVGGPLCESGDIFTQEEGGFVTRRLLPQAGVGDLLAIGCAGAYGFVMGSNYNSKPLAAEVMVYNGRAELIRRRQSFDEMIIGETIPRWD